MTWDISGGAMLLPMNEMVREGSREEELVRKRKALDISEEKGSKEEEFVTWYLQQPWRSGPAAAVDESRPAAAAGEGGAPGGGGARGGGGACGGGGGAARPGFCRGGGQGRGHGKGSSGGD
jgi:hypothetical protein